MTDKAKLPSPTVAVQAELDALATGLALQWFSAGWTLRIVKPEYHIDYLLESVLVGEHTGKYAFIQQKAHESIVFKNGFAKGVLKVKHLRYYAEKAEFPVFFLFVDGKRRKGWYLFAQEWIDKNLTSSHLTGSGTRTVTFAECQAIDNGPGFLDAFKKAQGYMREKYPGSLTAACKAEELRLSKLDPRLEFRVDIVNGIKHVQLSAKPNQVVRFTLTVAGEDIKPIQELVDYGKPIAKGLRNFTLEGFPNLGEGPPLGGRSEFTFSPEGALETRWTITSHTDPYRFRLTVDGSFTQGSAGHLFQGTLKDGPLKVEVKLTRTDHPDVASTGLKITWDFGCWEALPILNLAHFEDVLHFLQALKAGHRVKHVFRAKGREFFPGDFGRVNPDGSVTPGAIELIEMARTAAEAFNINPSLPALESLTPDDEDAIELLFNLATRGVFERSRPNQAFNVSFAGIADSREFLEHVDLPPRELVFPRSEHPAKLFGQEIRLGAVETTLVPARIEIAPEVRELLEQGYTGAFSARVFGSEDATLILRRLPTEKPAPDLGSSEHLTGTVEPSS